VKKEIHIVFRQGPRIKGNGSEISEMVKAFRYGQTVQNIQEHGRTTRRTDGVNFGM
jgi:hypothetical protein